MSPINMSGSLKTFPVKKDKTFIPESFALQALDIQMPEFSPLRSGGCSSVIMVDSDAGWRIARRGGAEYPHIDFFVVFSGSIEFCFEQETKLVKPGELMICPSWFDRYVALPEPGKHLYCCFSAVEQYPYRRLPEQQTLSNTESILFYFNELWNFSFDLEYRREVAKLFFMLLQRSMQNEMNPTALNINKFLDLFNAKENFSVANLAKKSGMSVSTLRRFTLEHFHLSPRELINEIRMNRARGLLQYSDFPIDEIADMLGYADRFVFSKAFLHCTGDTPAAYRKKSLKLIWTP